MASSAIDDRRKALADERAMLEDTRSKVVNQLLDPAKAKQFVFSQVAGEGSMGYHGENIMEWIDNRLKEIEKLIAKLPFVKVSRVASVVNVIGRDFSQYTPNSNP